MSRVQVIDGNLCFSTALVYEMAVLTKGPEAAQAVMRGATTRIQDEEARQAMSKVVNAPVLVPLAQDDKHRRVYAFALELGQGVGAEIIGDRENLGELCTAFGYGFASVAEIEAPQEYTGVFALCFECGAMVGGIVASLFPEDGAAGFQPPDFDTIMGSFCDGLLQRHENSEWR